MDACSGPCGFSKGAFAASHCKLPLWAIYTRKPSFWGSYFCLCAGVEGALEWFIRSAAVQWLQQNGRKSGNGRQESVEVAQVHFGTNSKNMEKAILSRWVLIPGNNKVHMPAADHENGAECARTPCEPARRLKKPMLLASLMKPTFIFGYFSCLSVLLSAPRNAPNDKLGHVKIAILG